MKSKMTLKVVKKIVMVLVILGVNVGYYAIGWEGESQLVERSFIFGQEGNLRMIGTWTVVVDGGVESFGVISLNIEDIKSPLGYGVVFIYDYEGGPEELKKEHRQRFIFNQEGKAYFFGGTYGNPYEFREEIGMPTEEGGWKSPDFVEIVVILSTGKDVRGRVLKPQQ